MFFYSFSPTNFLVLRKSSKSNKGPRRPFYKARSLEPRREAFSLFVGFLLLLLLSLEQSSLFVFCTNNKSKRNPTNRELCSLEEKLGLLCSPVPSAKLGSEAPPRWLCKEGALFQRHRAPRRPGPAYEAPRASLQPFGRWNSNQRQRKRRGLVGVGTKASRREAYEGLDGVGTKPPLCKAIEGESWGENLVGENLLERFSPQLSPSGRTEQTKRFSPTRISPPLSSSKGRDSRCVVGAS